MLQGNSKGCPGAAGAEGRSGTDGPHPGPTPRNADPRGTVDPPGCRGTTGPAPGACSDEREVRVSPVNLPPLVEPATDLSIDEVKRYSRHIIIPEVAMAGQKRLKNAR